MTYCKHGAISSWRDLYTLEGWNKGEENTHRFRLLLLGQLLGRFDFFESDALRGAARLADSFRVRLPLRFRLFVSNGRNKGPADTESFQRSPLRHRPIAFTQKSHAKTFNRFASQGVGKPNSRAWVHSIKNKRQAIESASLRNTQPQTHETRNSSAN